MQGKKNKVALSTGAPITEILSFDKNATSYKYIKTHMNVKDP